MIRARLLIVVGLAVLLPSLALAAPSQPKKLTGYPMDVLNEVESQNLLCDELAQMLMKQVTGGQAETMLDVAKDILNSPRHFNDTSDTVFGPRLTALIVTASIFGLSDEESLIALPTTQCLRIVPVTWPPDSKSCRGRPHVVGEATSNGGGPPLNHPGELKLMNELERAARLRNCRLP